MRWRREDRQQPDDRPDLPAEEWLREFRPIRPDALTAADRDAARPAKPPAAPPDRRGEPAGNRGGDGGRGSPVRVRQDDGRPDAGSLRHPDQDGARRAPVDGPAPARGNPAIDEPGRAEPPRGRQPGPGGYRPPRNGDDYLAGRVLPPRGYRDSGDTYRGDEYAGGGAGDSRSRDGYPQGGAGDSRSRDGYPQGGAGDSRSRDGYPQGGAGDSRSRDGYPQGGDGYPQGGDGYPQGGDGYPQGGDGSRRSRDGYPQRDGYSQSRDGGRGSYPDERRPDNSNRPRPSNGFAPPPGSEYAPPRGNGHAHRPEERVGSAADGDSGPSRDGLRPALDSFPPAPDGFGPGHDDGHPRTGRAGYAPQPEDGFRGQPGGGYRPSGDGGLRPADSDYAPRPEAADYAPHRESDYAPRRDGGYPAGRDHYAPGRDDYPVRREQSYPVRRDDDYPVRRDENSARAPAWDYPAASDDRFAPHREAPRPRYDYPDRPADDRPADDRVRGDYLAGRGPAGPGLTSGRESDREAGRPDQMRPDPVRSDPVRSRTDRLPPPGPGPARLDPGSERAVGGGADLVPAHNAVAGGAEHQPYDRDDDTLTRPLPVILPGAARLPRPGPVEAPRGPFEAARPSQLPVRPISVTGSVEPPPADYPPRPRPIPEAATAKLDQIKDLYLTAEAIGEDALDKHFDQVSDRQRELIREFFERSEPGGSSPGQPSA